MRILEVHYSTSGAGAERFVVDLCNELSNDNEVFFCTLNDDSLKGASFYKHEILPSVSYINLRCKSGTDIRGIVRLYNTIRTVKPDIVHAHTDAINLWIPSLFYHKTKYFHTIHSLAQKRQYKPWLTPIYRFFYKRRIHAVTISQICWQSYVDLYGLNNALHIDNGRSQITPSIDLQSVNKEMEKYKKNSSTKIFIHVARCVEAKNEPLLFKTFCRLYHEGKDAVLLVIGVNYDTPENKYLLETATPNIYWLGQKSNVCDYLIHSDFFILSSRWEGLPISLLEAMSVGVIPVCTPVGGIPDVIKDRTLGYLSSSLDDEDFYFAVIDAIQNSDHFNRDHLKNYYQQNYSMRHCANQYIKAFKAHI